MLEATIEGVNADHAATSVSPCTVGEWWGDPAPVHYDSTRQSHSTGQAQLHQPGAQNMMTTSITEKIVIQCTSIYTLTAMHM